MDCSLNVIRCKTSSIINISSSSSTRGGSTLGGSGKCKAGVCGHRIFGIDVLVLGLICSSLGCGPLREVNTDRKLSRVSSDSSLMYAELEKSSSSRKMDVIMMRRDSLKADYSVEVWPEGKFSYSPESGFQGEASRFVVRGSQEKGSQMLSQQLMREDANGLTERRLQSRHKAEGVKKTTRVRKVMGWKTIICIGALACILIMLKVGQRFFRQQGQHDYV